MTNDDIKALIERLNDYSDFIDFNGKPLIEEAATALSLLLDKVWRLEREKKRLEKENDALRWAQELRE